MFSVFKPKNDKKSESCCSSSSQSCTIDTKKVDEEDNCCTLASKGKTECPICKEKAKGVLEKTFNALVKDEIKAKFDCFDGFYYCKTPSCKTVYFRGDTILTQEDIKVVVGLKERANPATVCYCFQWTKEKIKTEIQEKGESVVLEDIKAKMKNPGCSCEVLNPSGGCCLGDVSRAIKEVKIQLNVNF